MNIQTGVMVVHTVQASAQTSFAVVAGWVMTEVVTRSNMISGVHTAAGVQAGGAELLPTIVATELT